MIDMVKMALRYAARGFNVLPLHNPQEDGSCSCGDPECKHVGKHPRLKNWPEKASHEPKVISGWWKRWPSANIGIALKPSGLVCIDADDEETFEGFRKLLAEWEVDTLIAKTSRGGHFYFRPTNGDSFSGKLSDLDESWSGEVLGNSLVVAPPSRHVSGAEYSWVREDTEPAPLPEELRKRLSRKKDCRSTASGFKGRKYYEKILDKELERVRCSQKGNRNESLNEAAFNVGQILHSGCIEEDDAFFRLLEAAREAGLFRQEAIATIESGFKAGKKEPRDGDDRPIIFTDIDFKEQIDRTLDALLRWNEPPRLFNMNGELVSLTEQTDPPALKPVNAAGLMDFMASSARYMKPQKTTDKPMNPPKGVAEAILANYAGRFPRLTGLLKTPTLRENGSIFSTPGYDEETGLYLICPELDDNFTLMDESPSEAVREIEDIIQEFPFATEADRANALALLITAVIRPAIKGPTPLFVINATVASSGKTLLANVTSFLEGRDGSFIDVPGKDEELMKRIQASLLGTGGSGVMILDNHPSGKQLISPSLACLITGDNPSFRRLGSSDMHALKNTATVVVTGNNVQVGGDITRRVVEIRIVPKEPHPELRTGFVHPNLISYVRENRIRLVKAILSCAHQWFDAGEPHPSCPIVGSFEEWCRIVGGILEYAEITGFLQNRERIRETVDLDMVQWEEFLKKICELHPDEEFTCADIEKDLVVRAGKFLDFLPEELRAKYDECSKFQHDGIPKGFTHSLGKAFAARVGRRYNEDGLRLERSKPKHGINYWRIVTGD